MITVGFDRVDDDLWWEDFFPEWIDEEEKWSSPTCPEIPMPRFEEYGEMDVVVARVPCVRNVFRLQVNLMVANLLVRSGWENNQDRTVYAVFIGSCGPMWEIFRCDDLLWNEGEYRVYKPDLRRLKQKVIMPIGSCQLAPPYAEPVVDVGMKHARKAKMERDGSLGYSCTKYKKEGILCSHSLKVIRDVLRMIEIPSQYIAKRWTKQARAETVKDLTGNDIQVDVKF
ncbi:putative UDP-glucuronate:xylan alpha-glucuronosyltransferase 5 [Camellia sinensis]|uniref:putative UDP-glucuronate:xylan alpha-glucuronosyltransferase 5 n=1 Tax=Camellia sinensis TaxID=4442 RepID=UPI0010355130|nr:putative UDP-glucuronate:xylan alpha-glucuronosyltransferase 5 [Camellia sinensis]